MLSKENINIKLADNVVKDITPAKMREVLQKIDLECGISLAHFGIESETGWSSNNAEGRNSPNFINNLSSQAEEVHIYFYSQPLTAKVQMLNDSWLNYSPVIRFEKYKKKNKRQGQNLQKGFKFEQITEEQNEFNRVNSWAASESTYLNDLQFWRYFRWNVRGKLSAGFEAFVQPLGNQRGMNAPEWYASLNGRLALDLFVGDFVVTIYSDVFKIMAFAENVYQAGTSLFLKTSIKKI